MGHTLATHLGHSTSDGLGDVKPVGSGVGDGAGEWDKCRRYPRSYNGVGAARDPHMLVSLDLYAVTGWAQTSLNPTYYPRSCIIGK